MFETIDPNAEWQAHDAEKWRGYHDLDSIRMKASPDDSTWTTVREWEWHREPKCVCQCGGCFRLEYDSRMFIVRGTDEAVTFLRRHGYTSLVDARS